MTDVPDPSKASPLTAPGMTDLMVTPESIDAALLPDPDYACGAAYCDDPACNTHRPRARSHRSQGARRIFG